MDGKIHWERAFQTTTLYLILAYTFILYLYNKFIYEADKNIMNFIDQDYCKAYIRSKSLPALMDRYTKLLKKGQSTSDLVECQNRIEELIK
jgi:hypothetical protein